MSVVESSPGGVSGGTPYPLLATGTVVEVLCRWLHDLGSRQIHTVAGEAFLPLLAAAPDHGLEIVATRHESGAGFMAVAGAQLDGTPGVVAVNRAPGSANVTIALDAAAAAETPLIVIVGGIAIGAERGRAFQGSDVAAMLAPRAVVRTVTAATVLDDLAAARPTLSGHHRGPVVLVVAEDVWSHPAEPGTSPPRLAQRAPRAQRAAEEIGDALARARRPVVVAGDTVRRGRADTTAEDRLRDWAEHALVPVLAGNKAQDLLDNDHALYGGHLHVGTGTAVPDRLRRADVVVLLGQYPDDVTTRGWSGAPVHVVHAAPGPDDRHLGERRYAEDPATVLEALLRGGYGAGERDTDWVAGWHRLAVADRRWAPVGHDDGVDFGEVVSALDDGLTGEVVLTLDAGNFSSWVHRHLRVGRHRRLLALPNGAMGFGVPAAVEAARRCPERTVVGIVGDGGVLMTGNELATARAQERCPVVVVADNGSYGTIHEHARRRGLTPLPGTALFSPDLVTWARAFGIPGERITTAVEVRAAVGRALAAGPDGYLLHVRTSLSAGHAYRNMEVVS